MAKTDTYGLYDTWMWVSTMGYRIQRIGVSGSYTYIASSDWANRPINCVSFWDACRFANWLHNGQPTGLQAATTTERGAYTLDGYNGNDGITITRSPNARWALPTEDEWYKAAYYKGGGTNAGYWLYPTQSDSAPGQDMNDAAGNNANYRTDPYTYPIDSGIYHTTVVGEFQNSESAYGTFDQGGNLEEWNEAVVWLSWLGLRGGSDADAAYFLQASTRRYGYPLQKGSHVGFRVVAVPEPSAAVALLGGLAGIVGLRRREG